MAILLVFGACAPTSEPQSFPPPEGYSSWEEYNKATSQTPATTTPSETTALSEQAYALTISDHSSQVSAAFYELSALMANPLIGDDEWTLNVAVQLVTIELLYDEVLEINPPSSMLSIHNKYVQAMQHYSSATHLTAYGIDNLDVDSINQAIAEMNMGNQLVNEATEMLEEFARTHSQ